MNQLYADEVRRTPYLVSYWRLNEPTGSSVAADSSAFNELDGFYLDAANQGPSLLQDGDTSAASQIPLTNSVISVPDSPQLRVAGANQSLSLEACVANPGQSCVLVGKMSSNGEVPAPYALTIENGIVGISIGNENTSVSCVAPIQILFPSHVCATVFRDVMAVYVNGIPVASALTGGFVSVDAEQPVIIGGTSSTPFSAPLSEVAVYQGALSARLIARRFSLMAQIFPDPAHYRSVDPPVFP